MSFPICTVKATQFSDQLRGAGRDVFDPSFKATTVSVQASSCLEALQHIFASDLFMQQVGFAGRSCEWVDISGKKIQNVGLQQNEISFAQKNLSGEWREITLVDRLPLLSKGEGIGSEEHFKGKYSPLGGSRFRDSTLAKLLKHREFALVKFAKCLDSQDLTVDREQATASCRDWLPEDLLWNKRYSLSDFTADRVEKAEGR